jgi:MFS transporter, DHA1 family, multidrug resistance protein
VRGATCSAHDGPLRLLHVGRWYKTPAVLILPAWATRLRGASNESWARALGALWVSQVVAEVAFSFALPFIPLYLQQELGVTDAAEAGLWAGAMAGSFAVTMGIMGPVWGAIADRFGRKLMVQRALFGAGVAIGAMSLARTPEHLLILRVIQGSLTGVVVATTTIVSLMVPRRHLGSALGLMHAALFAGGSLGPIFGGLFADTFGYRSAFGATAFVFFLSGTLVTLFVPEPPRQRSSDRVAVTTPPSLATPGAAPIAPVAPPGTTTKRAKLVTAPLIAIIVLSAAIRFANFAPQPVLPLFIQQMGEGSEHLATTVGMVVAATGVAGMLSAVTMGRVSDRYGRTATLLVCLLVAAVLSPLHALATSVWQLLVLRTAIGFALGGMSPAVQAVMTELTPPERRGAAFGLLTLASAFGNGAGPVLGSAIAAAHGIPAVFVATAPVFLLCAASLMAVRMPARAPEVGL